MIINKANLARLYVGFVALVGLGVASYTLLWPQIATEIPSTKRTEEYRWLGKFPRVREWIGDRVWNNLTVHGFSISNRKWEVSQTVEKDDIEDDDIGLYNPLFQAMGQESVEHQDRLVFEVLLDGFTGLCYDGQAFFDTDHPVGETTASNKGTAAFSAEAYASARSTMQNLTDENGKPLFIKPNLLLVDPANEGLAKTVLKSEKNPDGTANTNYGTAELLVVPGLGTAWFLMDTKRPVKPLILQMRRKPEFVSQDKDDDDSVVEREEYRYGYSARYNVGYALWQLAYGSTGVGNG